MNNHMTSIQQLFVNKTQNISSFLPAILTAASALVGYLAYGKGGYIAISVLFPLLWAFAPTRKTSFFICMGYYLAGSRALPSAAGVFFGEETSYFAGSLMWIAAAAINAVPWIALWTCPGAKSKQVVAIRTIGALLLGILPPIGLIGWMSPLLAAASVFPKGGLVSFALGSCMIVVFVCLAWEHRVRTLTIGAVTLIAVILAETVWLSPLPHPDEWVAANLNAGPFPLSVREKFDRNKLLVLRSADEIQRGAKVIIFPEQIAGWWGDLSTKSMLGELLKAQPEGSETTIIFGAEVHIPGSQANTNSMIFMSQEGIGKLNSRQAVPIALWKPWDEASTPSNWALTNVVPIHGTKVLFSVCYEDFLPFLPILSFLTDNPQMIVSVSNAWWVRNTEMVEIQEQHIAAIAKIYGVPLMRAVNRG